LGLADPDPCLGPTPSNPDKSNKEKVWYEKCETLSTELIEINKENTRLKKENKILAVSLKKLDSDKTSMVDKFQGRDAVIQKLRDENSDLSLMINNDRSTSLRQLEVCSFPKKKNLGRPLLGS
jgi:hypothetical protein